MEVSEAFSALGGTPGIMKLKEEDNDLVDSHIYEPIWHILTSRILKDEDAGNYKVCEKKSEKW